MFAFLLAKISSLLSMLDLAWLMTFSKSLNKPASFNSSSIIEIKDESDMDSFLSGETVDFKHGQIKGLDDFELICFLVIKEEQNA